MKNFEKLVRLNEISKIQNFPITRATIYKWRHVGKYPDLFTKFGGTVLIDMDKLTEILESGRGK